MLTIVLRELIFFFRLVLACFCGGIIGYERKNRGKGAGIRTHIIVALASSLMMIVSKYGFSDMIIGEAGVRGADGARIAAQVVSGVGFLGAGMIYFNRNSVRGLTTAAGIWATSGVGLAVGAGMYGVGIMASVMIVVIQIILHKNLKIMHMPNEEFMKITIEDNQEAFDFMNSVLAEHEIVVTNMKCTRHSNGTMENDFTVNVPSDLECSEIMQVFQKNKCIISISI